MENFEFIKKGQYRQMGMIKTPPNMTKQGLKEWWFEHARRFKHLEGMKWYTVLFTLEDNPFGPPPFDGYAEIWFESLDDLKKAFATQTEQAALEHVKEYGLLDPQYHQAVWAEEYIIELEQGYSSIPNREGMYRQMGTLKTPPNMTKQGLKEWWFEHARRFKHLEGMKWYTVLFTLEDNPFGPPPFDGYAEIWFESLDDLKKAFATQTEQAALEHVKEYGLWDSKYIQEVWAEEHIIQLK